MHIANNLLNRCKYNEETTLKLSTIAFALGLLFITIGDIAEAKSPVWKVTKGSTHLYIGGTIHLLSAKDYPLPSAFDSTFDQADKLVFETDVSSANDLATQMKMLPVIMSQNGETLESRLDPEVWQELKVFVEARGLPLPMIQGMTPAGFNLALLALELQKMGITAESGVETFFNKKAADADKSIAWLESLEAQLAVLNKMNEIDANVMIKSTMKDIDNLPEQWSELLKLWRAGDMQGLEGLALDQILDTSPELYDALLVQRNKNWIPIIEEMLGSEETELVLVGALHLSGEHSVLKMLKKNGAEIEQLD